MILSHGHCDARVSVIAIIKCGNFVAIPIVRDNK